MPQKGMQYLPNPSLMPRHGHVSRGAWQCLAVPAGVAQPAAEEGQAMKRGEARREWLHAAANLTTSAVAQRDLRTQRGALWPPGPGVARSRRPSLGDSAGVLDAKSLRSVSLD